MEEKYIRILHDTSHKNSMWACKMIPVLIYWASVNKRPLVKTLLVLEGTMPFAKASEARALHINYEENITPY